MFLSKSNICCRVKQGIIHVDMQTGRELDILTRRHLWNSGLDYRHGTGHGIGMYLGVHEGKA